METVKIDYREDFDILIIIQDKSGAPVSFKDCDFEFLLSSSGSSVKVRASKSGDNISGCYDDDGKIHIPFRHHNLPAGTLDLKIISISAPGVDIDGQPLFVPRLVGVELVPAPTPPDTVLMVPVDDDFFATEVESEEYMQRLIAQGYTRPGHLYFIPDEES